MKNNPISTNRNNKWIIQNWCSKWRERERERERERKRERATRESCGDGENDNRREFLFQCLRTTQRGKRIWIPKRKEWIMNGRGEKRTLKMKEKEVGIDKCGVNLGIGG
jgi:hypothetical protein